MHTKTRKIILLLMTILMLAIAGGLAKPLDRMRARYALTSAPVKGTSPGIVLLTTMLGAFRGVIVDVVWIRMESLKQDGKFFEIAQLADLACKLAPRFPKVWDFNAWNMAYNVSVQIPQYTQRWPWVQKGIELLRDKGIPNNPTEPELYFSLGWTLMNKVGGTLDEAHFWYKQQFGLKMHEIFGGSGAEDRLEQFAEAPTSQRQLLLDEEVNDLYNKLLQAGFDPLEKDQETDTARYFVYLRNPDAVPEAARRLLEAEENASAVGKIDTFVRAQRIKNELHMDLDIMRNMVREFGPFDWRSPYPHAIYWATRGRKVASEYRESYLKKTGKELDKAEWQHPYRYFDIDYDRIIYGSLQQLVRSGRLLYDSTGHLMPLMGPDYRFTDTMIEYYDRMLEKYGSGERVNRGVKAAYKNFLERVTIEYYYMGDREGSQRYYEKLREKFGRDKYKLPYDNYVKNQIMDYVKTAGAPEMRNLVRALLYRSYFNLGAGIDDRATALYRRAEAMAELWNQRENIDRSPSLRIVVDFGDIRESVLIDIFAGKVGGFSQEIMRGLEERLPEETVERIKQAAEKEKGSGAPGLKPLDVPEEYQRRLP
jgi:hypothetical protein